MAYVKSGSGRIGEHVQHIQSLLRGKRRVLCDVEGVMILPVLLPFLFYVGEWILAHGNIS